MQELHDSDYTLMTTPGTSNWDHFKYGNELWQQILKDKFPPSEEHYKLNNVEKQIEWMMTDKNKRKMFA